MICRELILPPKLILGYENLFAGEKNFVDFENWALNVHNYHN